MGRPDRDVPHPLPGVILPRGGGRGWGLQATHGLLPLRPGLSLSFLCLVCLVFCCS
jgi:hypothetical protein